MTDLLPAWPLLGAFLAASLVLALTPGPAVVYLLTRTLAQGRRAGLASVLGVALGNLGNALGAAIGLAALFAVSSLAFTVVKYAGAAYLVYLGVQALRVRLAARPERAARRDLRRGGGDHRRALRADGQRAGQPAAPHRQRATLGSLRHRHRVHRPGGVDGAVGHPRQGLTLTPARRRAAPAAAGSPRPGAARRCARCRRGRRSCAQP